MNKEQSLALENYLAEIAEARKSGHATEHTYRGMLATLVKGLVPSVNPRNEPKRSEHGNPDFVFTAPDIILGYAETKDVGFDLDKTEKTNQMDRYRGYANLILTDYLEFRFYKNGEKYQTVSLGSVSGDNIVSTPPPTVGCLLSGA